MNACQSRESGLDNLDHLQTNNNSARAIASVCGSRICLIVDFGDNFPFTHWLTVKSCT